MKKQSSADVSAYNLLAQAYYRLEGEFKMHIYHQTTVDLQ